MKKLLSIFLIPALIFLINAALMPVTNHYYVSASGSDSNSGTSSASPFLTIAKVNSLSLVPGDIVSFNGGDTFYGTLNITHSGSAGNSITYNSYGTGNATITGFTTVSAWTNLGSNIWESTGAVSTLSTCNMVVINGVNTPMGRYPNTGYLPYQSHSGNTSITSSSLTGTPNWTGAQLVMRSIRWMLERNPITSQSGGTLTYTGGSSAGTNGYGFFIQNDVRTLDTTNEWYYNPATKKIRIYSTTMPTNVEVPAIEELVLNNKASFITYDHIDFRGANSYLFENRDGKSVIVQRCSFIFSGITGYFVSGYNSTKDEQTINNCVFSDNNEHAMDLTDYTGRSLVQYNNINNTNIIPGTGSTSQGAGDAINLKGNGSVAEYNTINNTGHIAINISNTDGLTARYNYITYFGMTRYDAGGIYSWNQDSTITTNRIIDHNIIMYAKATSDGIGTDSPSLFGIYIDGDSKNTTITNNTVAHIQNGDGIFILNSGSVTIRNNTCFDNKNQLEFTRSSGGMNIANMIVKNNFLISKGGTQLAFSYRDDNNSFKFGTADSNYYARPVDDSLTIATSILYTPTNRTLAGWQTYSGFDAHSHKSPVTITSTGQFNFLYNATSSPVTTILPFTYVDVTNTSYSSITLQPYSSAVLLLSGPAPDAPAAPHIIVAKGKIIFTH